MVNKGHEKKKELKPQHNFNEIFKNDNLWYEKNLLKQKCKCNI